MSQDWKHTWHDVAVFESKDTGKSFETFLRDNGFESRTSDDKWFRYFLFLRPPRVVYHVQVRKNHFSEATELLETNRPAVLSEAMHCPSCDSLRVNYPQMTRRFLLPTVLLHLGIIFRVVEHECYCEHCHHMWTLPGTKSSLGKMKNVKPFPF